MELLKYIQDNFYPTIISIGTYNGVDHNGILHMPNGEQVSATITGLGTTNRNISNEDYFQMGDLTTGSISGTMSLRTSDAVPTFDNDTLLGRATTLSSSSFVTATALRSSTEVMVEQLREEMTEVIRSTIREEIEQVLRGFERSPRLKKQLLLLLLFQLFH